MARSHRRRAGKRSLAWAACALPAVLCLASPARAEAREGLDDDTLIALIGGGAIAADLMIFSYDVGLVAGKKHASIGWSVAQTVITVPQTIAFGAMAVGSELDDEEEVFAPAFVASMFVGAMTTHGIWSLASDQVSPLDLFTVSPVIAGNTVLTAAALVKATAGELGSPALAITEIALGGPSSAFFIYRSAADEDRAGWIGLSVWSGVLLLHGAASLFAWRADEIDKGESARGRLPQLPFTIQGFGPSMVSDGFVSVPGVQIAGSF